MAICIQNTFYVINAIVFVWNVYGIIYVVVTMLGMGRSVYLLSFIFCLLPFSEKEVSTFLSSWIVNPKKAA